MVDTSSAPAAREISPELVTPLFGYLEAALGREAVHRVLEQLSGQPSLEELLAPDRWVSLAEFDEIVTCASAVTGDDRLGRQVGMTTARATMGNAAGETIRALGSVTAAMAATADYASKMSVVRRLQVVEEGRRHVMIEGRYAPGVRPHRFSCDNTAGFFETLPALFDMFGTAVEVECECHGAARCLYRVAWTRDPSRSARNGTPRPMVRGLSQVEQLESYHEAASHLVEANDVTDVLDRIVGQVSSSIKAPGFLLRVHLPGEEAARVHHRGLDPAGVDELVEVLERSDALPPEAVVAPVESEGRTIGQLVAVLPPDTSPSAYEHRTLRSYARYATAALHVVLALDGARTDRDTATALLELSRALAKANDVQGVVEELARCLPAAVDCDLATVWLLDPASGDLRLGESIDRAGRRSTPAVDLVTRGRRNIAILLEEHRPRLIQTAQLAAEDRILMERDGLAEVVLLPIVSRGNVFGMATAGYRTPVCPEDRATVLERVRGMADQAAVAIANAHLLEQMRHQALHDDLTGLPKRALVEDRCDQALARSERSAATVAVLFIDLDGFKAVNDSLGHRAGDALLCEVAERVRSFLRSADTCARLGGDEFVVVLADLSGADEAADIAGRLVDALRAPFEVEGHELAVTASVGIACADDPSVGFEALLQRSDAAMYRAKRAGRDTYVLER